MKGLPMTSVFRVLDRERSVAPPGFSRWLVPPAALAVHLSIGQVYAFSVFKTPLVTLFGSSQTAIGVVFSIAIAMLGLSAAFGGAWMERNGPRKAMVLSAICWSVGFFVAALGLSTGQLWLVYLGYGVIGGIGLGIGYISPVSTLIKWFPDRPGLATGLAIMGFGGGALIASPLSNRLMQSFGGDPKSTVPTFLVLGALYLVVMLTGAAVVRVPPPDWAPAGWTPPAPTESHGMRTTADVTARNAIRTPQFWLLWVVLFCNVTAGIGILEEASPMIRAFFGNLSVTEAAGYVGLLSLADMAGRFVWSSTSDLVGRKPIYMLYLGAGCLLYLLLVLSGTSSVLLFVGITVVILSFYGGGFATVPAYLKDLFGSVQVGAIHGRLLTAWSAAGIVGPLIVNRVVDSQTAAGRSGSGLYTLSLSIMVGVLAVGFVANLLVRPVNPRFHEPVASVTTARPPAPAGAPRSTRPETA
jgi:MFS family permease